MPLFFGKIKFFDMKRAFGFIIPLRAAHEDALTDISGAADVFVHIGDVVTKDPCEFKSLYTGEYVQYELGPNEHGQDKAVNVKGMFGDALLCENGRVRFTSYTRRQFGDEQNPAPQQTPLDDL